VIIPFFIFIILIIKTGMYWIFDNVDNGWSNKTLEAGVIITWTCAPALIKVELMLLFYRLQFHQKFQVEFSYRLKLT
jgi:hypothetical protein